MTDTHTFTMSQDIIDLWAHLSCDQNPLHVSEEYARATKFGGTIAHGHYSLALIEDLLYAAHGEAWLSGGLLRDLKFTAPVRPGRSYVVSTHARESGQRVEVRDVEDGTLAVQGLATLQSR
jgi:acyl dehydratase